MATLSFDLQTSTHVHAFSSHDVLNDAEIVNKQESCGGFWSIAMIVGMLALAIFGIILAIEWPALMIPSSIIIGGHLLVELGYLLSRTCCGP